MGKPGSCMVLVWQGRDRGQQFIHGHCFSPQNILSNMQSWGCLLYMHDSLCIMHSSGKLQRYTLHWGEAPGGILTHSPVLTELFLGQQHCTALLHSTITATGESKLQGTVETERSSKFLRRNADQCMTLEESQGSLKNWLCTSLQLKCLNLCKPGRKLILGTVWLTNFHVKWLKSIKGKSKPTV